MQRKDVIDELSIANGPGGLLAQGTRRILPHMKRFLLTVSPPPPLPYEYEYSLGHLLNHRLHANENFCPVVVAFGYLMLAWGVLLRQGAHGKWKFDSAAGARRAAVEEHPNLRAEQHRSCEGWQKITVQALNEWIVQYTGIYSSYSLLRLDRTRKCQQ